MRRKVPTSGGAELCAESLGDPDDPALLLIGGMAWSLDYWDDALCERLTGRGLRVIRYDHRDTGESTSYPPGEPGYTGGDLAADALAVLDGLEVDRAHLCGLSMGGGISQELGINHRDRVRSLTLMATSFARDAPDDLPGRSAVLDDEPPLPDWSDRAAAADYLVAIDQRFAGADAFDEPRARALAQRVLDRTRDIASAQTNHWTAASGRPTPGHFADLVGLPALVVHGTDDPLFPIEHGRALAAALPGSRLLELEGVGHQLPPPDTWDRLIDAVCEVVSDG